MAAPSQKNSDVNAEIEKYRKALDKDPDSRLFAALADALRRSGDLEAAIEVAKNGVETHPRYMGGIVVLAQAYQDDKRYEEALELFTKVIRMNPENIVAQRALAEINDRVGNHEAAMKAYATLVILDPTDTRAKERLDILEATSPSAGGSTTATEVAVDQDDVDKGAESTADLEPETESEKGEDDVRPEEPETGEAGDNTVEIDRDSVAEQADAHDPQESTDPGKPAGVIPHPGEEEDATATPDLPPELALPNHDEQGARAEDAGHEIPPLPDPVMPASQPAAAQESEESQAAGGLEEIRESVKESKAEKAKDKKGDMTEEEKLDLFFSGVELEQVGIAEKADGYVVKDAGAALPDDEGADGEIEIRTNKMAALFWSQGFGEKALAVLAHELYGDRENEELKMEYVRVCRALEINPKDFMTEIRRQYEDYKDEESGGEREARSEEPEEGAADGEGSEDESGPEAEPEDEPERAAAEDAGASDEEDGDGDPEELINKTIEDGSVDEKEKISFLKSYLSKMKKEKGKP